MCILLPSVIQGADTKCPPFLMAGFMSASAGCLGWIMFYQ